MCLGARRSGRLYVVRSKLGERRIGAVIGKSTSLINGNVAGKVLVEIGSNPFSLTSFQVLSANLLVLCESITLKLFVLGRDIAPQASLSANGACTLNDKADVVRSRRRRRRHVNVRAYNIGSTIVFEGKEVDLLVASDGRHFD
jgi:hypothetical protein